VLLQGLKKPSSASAVLPASMPSRVPRHRNARWITLPSYRGRQRQSPGFHRGGPRTGPQLLLRGYERASLTLNFVRALIDGGFADLHHPEYWDLSFLRHAALRDAYQKIVDSIAESWVLRVDERQRCMRRRAATFIPATKGCTCSPNRPQTRYNRTSEALYNLSTHMPWIGMRTADIDGAHIDIFAASPIPSA